MYGRAVLNIAIITILLCGLSMSALMGQGPNVPATLSLGQEPYGAYSSSATETVNLYDGNVNVVLNLIWLKGRNGQDINMTLAYNSKQIVKRSTGSNAYAYDWLYKGRTEGRWVLNNMPQKTNITTVPGYCSGTWFIKPAYIITMPDGSMHEMHYTTTDGWINTQVVCSSVAPTTWAGNYRSITGTIMEYRDPNGDGTGILYLKNGNRIDFTKASNGLIKGIDTNGNILTYNIDTANNRPSSVVDNLGRSVTFTYDGPAPAGKLTQATVSGVNQIQTYTFQYTNLRVNTALNDSGAAALQQYVSVLSSVTLPNGLKYQFEYDRGPWDSPQRQWTSTLKLTKITYPVGGYTRYVYAFVKKTSPPSPPEASDYVDTYVWDKYRNALDGKGEVLQSWRYDVDSMGNTIDTAVYNPDGGSEVHFFNSNGLETSIDYRSPQSTLRRVVQDWTFELGDDCATRYNARIIRQTRYEYINNLITYLQSKVEYDYDTSGYSNTGCGNPPPPPQVQHTNRNVTAQREYDFGLNAVGPLVRRTANSYLTTAAYQNLHILDRITSQSVYNPPVDNVNPEAQTNYRYDEGTLTNRTGATGHDDTNYGVTMITRGNLTSLAPMLLSPLPARELFTRNSYDILGNVVQVTPPRSSSIIYTYGYADNYQVPPGPPAPTYAYVTTVTKPSTQNGSVTHVESRKYYFPTGQLYQATDENNNTSSVTYDNFNRVSAINFPDTGQTSFGYTDSGPPALTPGTNDWEFDTDGNPEGWTALQQLTTFTVSNSTLQTSSTGTSPQMQSPALTLDSAQYKLVAIRMQVSAGTWAGVYFQNAAGGTGGVNFTLPNKTDFVTYYFDMGTLAAWTGQITRLTLAPSDTSGANINIDYIRVYGVGSPLITKTQKITATTNLVDKTYFDGLGRVKRKQLVDASQGDVFVDTEYDSRCGCPGRTFRVSNPYRTGETVRWTAKYFDVLGRIMTVVPADGTSNSDGTGAVNSITYAYGFDTVAKRLTVTISDQAGKTREQEYDGLGRMVALWEPDSTGAPSLETDYSYNTADQVTSITQWLQDYTQSQTRSFDYDSLRRLVDETHPENGLTNYTYDDNGNVLTKWLVGRNIQASMSYDELDRILTKSYTGDGGVTPSVTYGYDAGTNNKGRLTSVSNTVASSVFNYDVMGRTLSESKTIDSTTFSLSYTYNLIGDVTTTTYPNGMVITNTYNAANRLTQLTSSVNDAQHPPILAQNLAYSAAGAVTSVSYGNTLIGTRNYNSRLQLGQVQVGVSGSLGSVMDFGYNYNENTSNNGQVVRINNNLDRTQDVAFSYDELSRLKTAESNPGNVTGWGLSWTYDRYANRSAQSATKGAPPTSSLTIDRTTNRISGYTYDGAGNLTNDGSKTYTYDGENRLTQISLVGSGLIVATYRYDANNQRVKKVVGLVPTLYFFGVGEYRSATWQKLYVGVPGARVEYNGDGTMFWYHLDRLGTARAVTDINGTVVVRKDYYPFGEEIGSTTNNEQKFTGYYRDDESRLDYAVNRYNNSGMGRFMTADPYSANTIYNPQGLNKYAYVENDPVNYTDRLGLKKDEEEDDSTPHSFPDRGPGPGAGVFTPPGWWWEWFPPDINTLRDEAVKKTKKNIDKYVNAKDHKGCKKFLEGVIKALNKQVPKLKDFLKNLKNANAFYNPNEKDHATVVPGTNNISVGPSTFDNPREGQNLESTLLHEGFHLASNGNVGDKDLFDAIIRANPSLDPDGKMSAAVHGDPTIETASGLNAVAFSSFCGKK